MSRYLDPKADVVFKKIFAQHPDLLISFLNAVLPLAPDNQIETLEYLFNEQVPVIPAFKSTIVDVSCKDHYGRSFIVEMQIQWTNSFMQRMLFNASKAYVKQLQKGEEFHLLKPVYGLGLINSEFDANPDDWYHHYKMVNVEKPQCEIKDLQLVFIELPKFQAKTLPEKKLKVLWLRFMSELDSNTKEVPPEWLAVPEIKKAVHLAEEAAYSPAELAIYEKYWDMVSVEKTLLGDSYRTGKEEGLIEGRAEGKTEGRIEAQLMIADKLLASGMKRQEVALATGLSLAELEKIGRIY